LILEQPRIIAAAFAPMSADKNIFVEVIKEYRDYLQTQKISGVFINGSTGDFPSLSKEERKSLTLEWSNHRLPNFKVIDHVGHTSLKIARELAEFAADKVDGIAAIAPYYFKPKTMDSLLEYCVEIAKGAPELPFYYYHLPILTGVDFVMSDFIEKLSQQIPNFKGIKFTHDNFDDFVKCKSFNPSGYDILFGYDEYFLDSLAKGASGWVGSTFNHLMPLYHQIYSLSLTGKVAQAKQLQSKVFEFVEILNSHGGYNGVSKGLMRYLGVDVGPSRYPHHTPSKDTFSKILTQLEDSGIAEYLPLK
jgi:N-acetylneuraminate lyase